MGLDIVSLTHRLCLYVSSKHYIALDHLWISTFDRNIFISISSHFEPFLTPAQRGELPRSRGDEMRNKLYWRMFRQIYFIHSSSDEDAISNNAVMCF